MWQIQALVSKNILKRVRDNVQNVTLARFRKNKDGHYIDVNIKNVRPLSFELDVAPHNLKEEDISELITILNKINEDTSTRVASQPDDVDSDDEA